MHPLLLPLQPLLQGDAAPTGGLLSSPWFPLIAIGLIFWFVVIGPERKQRALREKMLAGLKKGDKVLTTGGMYGSVAQVQENVVTVQISDGVRVRFARSAIQTLTDGPKGGSDKGAAEKGDSGAAGKG